MLLPLYHPLRAAKDFAVLQAADRSALDPEFAWKSPRLFESDVLPQLG